MLPHDDFDGEGQPLHFAHANGFPPRAYRPLLEILAGRQRVQAMHLRPLWPDADPRQLPSWSPLSDDLLQFLETTEPEEPWIGIGHSLGAVVTLRAALRQPARFRALILVDPVLTWPWFRLAAWMLLRSGAGPRVHRLARGALRRRTVFPDLETMFSNYRRKAVFRKMSDSALRTYVEAVSRQNADGRVHLIYPPEWEARIYLTAYIADGDIWDSIQLLKIPLLIVRGEHSDTFARPVATALTTRAVAARSVEVPDSTHLLPLERPVELAHQIQVFIDQVL